jgi:hypothetical protein
MNTVLIMSLVDDVQGAEAVAGGWRAGVLGYAPRFDRMLARGSAVVRQRSIAQATGIMSVYDHRAALRGSKEYEFEKIHKKTHCAANPSGGIMIIERHTLKLSRTWRVACRQLLMRSAVQF